MRKRREIQRRSGAEIRLSRSSGAGFIRAEIERLNQRRMAMLRQREHRAIALLAGLRVRVIVMAVPMTVGVLVALSVLGRWRRGHPLEKMMHPVRRRSGKEKQKQRCRTQAAAAA